MRRGSNPKADLTNAHVRKRTARRQQPDVKAEEADRLLNDPAFLRAYTAVHEGMVNEIVSLKHDGSREVDDLERECCRVLRTLNSMRRALAMGVQGQKLRLAEFQSIEPEPEKTA